MEKRGVGRVHTHTHTQHQPFNHHRNKRYDCLHLKRFHPDGNYRFNIHEGTEVKGRRGEMEQDEDGVCVCVRVEEERESWRLKKREGELQCRGG